MKKLLPGLFAFGLIMVSCTIISPDAAPPESTSPPQVGNTAPMVSVSASTVSLQMSEVAILTATASDSDGDVLTYQWFVDAAIQTGETAQSFSFSNSSPGTYNVQVSVSDGKTNVTDSIDITVHAPSVSFSLSSDITAYAGVSLSNTTANTVHASGNNIFVGMQSEGLLYSTDAGANWNQLTTSDGLTFNQVNDIEVAGDYVFIATFAGLSIYNTNTQSFETSQLGSNVVNTLFIYGSNVYAGTNSNGIFVSDTSTINFSTQFTTADGLGENKVQSLFVIADTIYAAGDNYLTIANLDFSSHSATEVADSSFTDTLGPIHVKSSYINAAVGSHISRSSDGGTTYIDDYSIYGGAINGFALDGTYLLSVVYGGDLWLSPDDGANWQSLIVPGYDTFFGVMAKDIFCDGTTVYIAHNSGLIIGDIQ